MNNTGNAVPSTNVLDFVDNVQVLDQLINGDDLEVKGRLGKELKSVAYLQNILSSLDVGSFTFADITSGLSGTTDGQYFRVPQGTGSDLSFIYYKNSAGTAVEVATMASANIKDDVRKNSLAGIKIDTPFTHSGELLNGATGWNGLSTVDGIGYGGWQVPAGQTGDGTYISSQINLTASQVSTMAGHEVRFIFGIKHSANVSSLIENASNFKPSLWVDGNSVDATGVKVVNLTSESSVAIVSIDVTSSNTAVSVALQLVNSTALTEAMSFITASAYYVLVSPEGYIKELDAYSAAKDIPPADNNLALQSVFVSAANGAALDATGSGLSIPAGATGLNSYLGRFNAIHNERLHAGETVRLTATFQCSAGFLLGLSSYVIGVAKKLDGTQSTSAQIVGTDVLHQVSDTEFTISADYVISGNASEFAALYFQLKDSIYSATTRSLVLLSTSYFLLNSGDFRGDLARVVNQRKLTSGNLKSRLTQTGGQGLAGGVLDTSNNLATIPSGSTGNGTYIQFFMPPATIIAFSGSRVRARMVFQTSANALSSVPVTANIRVNIGTTQTNYAAELKNVKQLSSTLVQADVIYTLTGNETTLAPFIQVQNSTATTADVTFKLLDIRVDLLDVVQVGDTLNDQMLSLRQALLKSELESEINQMSSGVAYSKTVTVKQDGTGDYTSLLSAIAAVGGGSSNNLRTRYLVYSGIYTDLNAVVPKYCDIIGVGQPNSVWLKGELAANVDPTQIPLNQTLWWNDTARLENIKVTSKNMRYPIHSDSSASTDTSIANATQQIDSCHIEHYGNAEAQAYQTSISSGVTVWSSTHAWGCGLHSGESIVSNGTHFISPTTPFYFHTNKDFDKSAHVVINGGLLKNKNNGAALAIQNLGSGKLNTCTLNGVDMQGTVSIDSATWRAEQLSSQWGDRNQETKVYLNNCSPVPFKSTNGSTVLQLISVVGSSSSVALSGTAMAKLFGNPVIIAGSPNYAARAYSSHSVKGEITGSSLGARLGDCSTTNLTLTVTFDGGTAQNLTIASNYTSMSNDDVISALNTLLADSSGRAFSIVNPYDNKPPVYQADKEVMLTNTGSWTILKGNPVAYVNDKNNVTNWSTGYTKARFAGIALEDIQPGMSGRVQKSGRLMNTSINFSGTAGTTFLQQHYAVVVSSSSTGGVATSGDVAILQYIGYQTYELI